MNKELSITIQRGRHDKENPYVMISKKMLRDKDLSPKAKGVLCYLLSMCDTWKTHPRQVACAMGVGKDQIYTVLKELLQTGYAYKRQLKDETGRFGSVVYEFYEERLPESERFKEKTTLSGNQNTVTTDTETQTLRNNNYKENVPKEISPLISPQESKDPEKVSKEGSPKGDGEKIFPSSKKFKLDFSEEVAELAEKMVKDLHEANPDWLIPKNLYHMKKEIQQMITEDGRTPKKILELFMWALNDHFWMDKLYKPNPAKYLRLKFGELSPKMNAKPPKNPNQIDRRVLNKDGTDEDAYKDFLF